MKFADMSLIRKFLDFLREHDTTLAKYSSAQFTEAITNMNRLIANAYEIGQKAKSFGGRAYSAIDNAGMWIESLEELEDKEDFIETWDVIIDGLAKARKQAIDHLGEIQAMKNGATQDIESAIRNVQSMGNEVTAGMTSEKNALAAAVATTQAAEDKCKADEIEAHEKRNRQIAALTTQIAALEKQLEDLDPTTAGSTATRLRTQIAGYRGTITVLELKNLDSTNECAKQERALARALEDVAEQQVAFKQWGANASEMKSQITSILGSGPAATLQAPNLGALAPVKAGSRNYKSLNKTANALVAAATASKQHAKDLEKAGIAQMDKTRPSLLLI